MAEGRRKGRVPASWSLIGLGLLAIVTVILVVLAFRHVAPTTAIPADQTTTPTAPSTAATPTTATPTPTATTQTQKVVFVGDGFTAATTGNSWATLLSDQKGWTETNLAVDGAGYVTVPANCPQKPCKNFEGMIPQIVAAQPTIVVVAGGGADGNQDLTPVANRFYKALATSLPSARIIAVSPLWGATASPSWITKHAQSIEKAVIAAKGEYLDVGQPLLGKKDQVGANGLPNDEGQQTLATAMAAKLK